MQGEAAEVARCGRRPERSRREGRSPVNLALPKEHRDDVSEVEGIGN